MQGSEEVKAENQPRTIKDYADKVPYKVPKGQKQDRSWRNSYKQPSRSAIEQARMLLMEPYQQKYDRVQQFITSPTTNPYVGSDLTALAERYKEHDDKLKTTIDKLDHLLEAKNITSSDLGLTYQQRQNAKRIDNTVFNDAVYDKSQIIANATNLKFLKIALGLNDDEITNRQMKALILLDDWPSILAKAIPLIIEYGPKLANFLYEKFAKPAMQRAQANLNKASKTTMNLSTANTLDGHDTGLSITDFSNNNVQGPNKSAWMPGVNVFSDSIRVFSNRAIMYDGVNTKAIAATFCPEYFSARFPSYVADKTTLTRASAKFSLTTDANGNTSALLEYNNICTSSASATTAFLAINPTGFVPTTGAATNWTYLPGPLSGSNTSIASYRIVGMAATVIPTTSANNSQGQIELAYWQGQRNTAATPAIPQASLSTSGAYQIGNFLTGYRSIYTPDFLYYDGFHVENFVEYLQVLITGAPASSTVATLEVSWVLEIVPQIPVSFTNTDTQYAEPGPMSEELVSNIFNVFPAIQILTLDDAYALANAIYQSHACFNGVMEAILGYTKIYKPKTQRSGYVMAGVPSGGLIGGAHIVGSEEISYDKPESSSFGYDEL